MPTYVGGEDSPPLFDALHITPRSPGNPQTWTDPLLMPVNRAMGVGSGSMGGVGEIVAAGVGAQAGVMISGVGVRIVGAPRWDANNKVACIKK